MDDILFIGDELGSIAYGLAGVSVLAIEPGGIIAALDSLVEREELRLVLIGSPHAEALGIEELARRMRLANPPLMVVSDTAGTVSIPDFSTLLRRRLGVAT
jgi:CRP-like cAMP-binding protein